MIYQFSDCSLNCQRQELVRAGAPVAVEPQVFRLIVHLIKNRDRVVSKDELFEVIWEGRIVSDGTLNTRMATARAALGDDGNAQGVIKTFSRRGFRFVADVSETGADAAAPTSSLVPPPDKPSIAVLPFNNLSGDPEQEYFADGLVEDIITALSRIRSFFVIARNSTFHYKGTSPEVRKVANDLGIRYILEGSVRKAGDRVRISAQLIDGETGNHLWAERYDRKLEDIFAIQDEITMTVVGAIQPELSVAEQQRARRKSSENLAAWDFFNRGNWYSWRPTRENFEAARRNFEQAIELDPEFCLAHAYLAYTLWRTVVFQFANTPVGMLDDAMSAAKKAVALDHGDAHAHWAMGMVYMQKRDHVLAIEELERAIELNPSFSLAYHFLGWTMVYNKRVHEGIGNIQMAQRLSPDPSAWGLILILAQAHMNLKEFATAEKYARQAKRLSDVMPINAVLLAILGQTVKLEEAAMLRKEVLAQYPQFTCQTITEIFPLCHQDDIDIWVDGLRRAGVPAE